MRALCLLAAAILTPPAPVDRADALQPSKAEGLHTAALPCRAVDPSGAIVRSKTRRDLFRRLTGYPKGRPGYVVDHIIPLACGGCDTPSNMSWQTTSEGKAKDRWELDCARWQDGSYLRALERGRR